MRRLLLPACLFALVSLAPAESVDQYCNPLPVLLADPYVLRHDGTYYLYATSDIYNGYYVWTSPDLVHWANRGYAFHKTATSWGRYHFWAPEVVEKNGTFYLFYCASPTFQIANAGKRICLATAESPLGPFVDARAPLFDSVYDSIDADCFIDADARAYLYCAIEHGGNKIYAAPLSADLLTLTATPTLCVVAEAPWESAGEWHVNEAPFVLKHGDWYFMLYSGNGFSDPNYAVGYATAKSPLGPWKKYTGNPILHRREGVSGPGHNCLVQSPDGKEWFSVHHTHQWYASGGHRQLSIDRVHFVEEATGPARIVCDGPTLTPQPLPSGAKPFPTAQSDDFDGKALDRAHWIVFNESPEAWSLRDGALVLSPRPGNGRVTRQSLGDVFLQYAPKSDFEATLAVADATGAFLCLWRDHQNFVRVGVSRDAARLEVVKSTDGQLKSKEAANSYGTRLLLRLSRRGTDCAFSASGDGKTWTQVGRYPFDLPLPMIGMGALGGRRQLPVRFDSFRIQPLAPRQ